MTIFKAKQDVPYQGIIIRAGTLIRVAVDKLANCKACEARRQWLLRFFKEIK